MASNRKVMVLPGDGIGVEVMAANLQLVDWLAKHKSLAFDISEDQVGGAAYDSYGTPLRDETLADAMASDAVLFGAVGGPQYDELAFELKPERGLLALRKEMDLFANLRPAIVFDALVDASTLKPDVVSGLNIMILRELCGGSYFAEPRGIDDQPNGQKKGYDTNAYSTREIERIGRVAFDLARKRDGRVTSVEKSNVMMSGVLWREVMNNLHEQEGGDVSLGHMYADNCAMQLVRNPKQFDVIVTDNLFGDLLSDCAAMLTGSLGMLPSASLGAPDPDTGLPKAMYEPVHGSAPDIAGQNLANPLAQFLSFAMMLRYSFGQAAEADLVEKAVADALASGKRTGDIMAPGCEQVGTDGMTKAVLEAMNALAR
ncbi:MAG: 3-isopropylmalate dehydrogenase [Alphaproteobacteria bacterium]|nr:MAG: 3-isopropylmalate dehydrogenase [Alphaproteobacteria bacterium]|tara:strand:+ start:66 stop:1181 length:1116 start_codon:yes stop_codon:yes gene_type:complete